MLTLNFNIIVFIYYRMGTVSCGGHMVFFTNAQKYSQVLQKSDKVSSLYIVSLTFRQALYYCHHLLCFFYYFPYERQPLRTKVKVLWVAETFQQAYWRKVFWCGRLHRRLIRRRGLWRANLCTRLNEGRLFRWALCRRLTGGRFYGRLGGGRLFRRGQWSGFVTRNNGMILRIVTRVIRVRVT